MATNDGNIIATIMTNHDGMGPHNIGPATLAANLSPRIQSGQFQTIRTSMPKSKMLKTEKDKTRDGEIGHDLGKVEIVSEALAERTTSFFMKEELLVPKIVDRKKFQDELDALLV
jgi:hypothetical protein